MILKPSDFGGLCFWRVVIVGANGAGKTWLARRIARATGAPLVHNDALALKTGWRYHPRSEVARRRAAAIAGPRWVLEGGPSILTADVLSQATLVVWCDTPPALRMWRLLHRSLRYCGRTRPEHPPGNRDWPGPRQMRFIVKAMTSGRAFEAAILSALNDHAGPAVRLRTRDAVTALIKAAR